MELSTVSSKIYEQPASLISPRLLEQTTELRRRRHQIKTDPVYSLTFFSYGSATFKETTEDGILFAQKSSEGYGRDQPEAAIEIRSNGRLILEKAIPLSGSSRMLGGDALLEPNLMRTIGTALALSSALYDRYDPSKRQTSFWLAALVANPGMSYLLSQPPRDGTPINLRSREEAIVLAEAPRLISRHDLSSPAEAIERLMAQFRRKLGPTGNRR